MKSEFCISGEISAYEKALEAINQLKVKVKEGREELGKAYLGIIEAKKEFENVKKQNIEEIRQYRFAISVECKEISNQVEAIKNISTAVHANELRSFVESCERLNALSQSGFFDKLQMKA